MDLETRRKASEILHKNKKDVEYYVRSEYLRWLADYVVITDLDDVLQAMFDDIIDIR